MNDFHAQFVKAHPPLKSLVVFSYVCDKKNYTTAAEGLFLTQSAISHQIKNLEEFLGYKLFNRNGNDLVLTQAGLQLSESLKQAFSLIQSTISELNGHEKGMINIAIKSAYAMHIISPNLSSLYEHNPELNFSIHLLNCGNSVQTLNYDLILFDKPINNAFYECEMIKKEKYFPISHPSVMKELSLLNPTEWEKHVQLVDLTGINLWQSWFDQYHNGCQCFIQREFDQFTMILNQVKSAHSIAILGETLIQSELKDRNLVKLSENYLSYSNDGFYMVTNKNSIKKNHIRTIRNWIIKCILDN